MNLNYIKVLNELKKNNWIICNLEQSLKEPIEAKVFAIRHDIDDDIDRALRMAQIEKNMGVSSTYFLLVTHPYFQDVEYYSNQFIKLGHVIGLHLDLINMVNRTSGTLHDYLLALVMSLKVSGIKIKGTVPHGSIEASKAKFRGFEYFYDYCNEEYIYQVKNHIDPLNPPGEIVMGVHPLKQYELLYDATQLERKNYISDSHGNIRINTDINNIPNRDEELYEFIKTGSGKTIALFHPQHWKDV